MTRLIQDWMDAEPTRNVLLAFSRAGAELRFVGGCVRDGLLGRSVKDIDFATAAPPEETMRILQTADIKAIPTGLQHGTITAVIEGQHFEITTLRRDVSCDGRHAEVEYTQDWQQDASRRDFTMNALSADSNGKIYDYFGGIEDARKGIVRFIGDAQERIREDALRILRFFRFFAHYGQGSMDDAALAASNALAPMIDMLSGERIALEMFKLLVAPRAVEVIQTMQEQTILAHVIPAKVNVASMQAYHGRDTSVDAVISLALLLRSTAKANELLNAVRERWKLSNALYHRLKKLTDHPTQGIAYLTARKQKALIRKQGREAVCDEIQCVWSELASQKKDAEVDAYFEQFLALAREWEIPQFPITGEDLKARGIKEGRALGVQLVELEKIWEEKDYQLSKEELLKRLD